MSHPPEHPGNPNEPTAATPTRVTIRRRPGTGLRPARLRGMDPHQGSRRPATDLLPDMARPHRLPVTGRRNRATDLPRLPATTGLRPPPGYPASPGYGPPPGSGFDIGQAFGWAWNKFTKNIGPLILAALVYLVLFVVVQSLVFVMLGGASANTSADGDYGASFTAGLGAGGLFILQIITFIFGIFVQAALWSGLLDIADGRPVTVGSFFKPRNFGNVILAGALLAVISAVLNSLSLLPGFLFGLLSLVLIFVFAFFTLFTIAFATDRALAPIDALKASYAVVKANPGRPCCPCSCRP